MQGFGDIRQIAYLTDDMDAAMQTWMERSGMGPFTCYKNLTLPCHYKGEIRHVLMDVGIAFRGTMQIELIQQKNTVDSPYKSYFDNNQMGLHHLAYMTDDMDASLKQAESQGFVVLSTIDGATGRFAYFQDPAMPETTFEFLEVSPRLAQYWEMSIDAAKNWDGKSDVTVIDMSHTS